MTERLNDRIGALDSFRFFSILMVMFFHFYSRWTLPTVTSNYYPYNDTYANFFKYGYLGVELFFIISGFVIFFTLEKSISITDFFYKRLIRLLPAIVLCSVVTFIGINLIDPEQSLPELHPKTVLNFIPSLTFTPPILWQKILHNKEIAYINGSYWSLWIEVSFYVVVALFFFSNKVSFYKRWFLFFFLPVILLKLLSFIAIQNNLLSDIPAVAKGLMVVKKVLFSNRSLTNYLLYFSLGLFFYKVFTKKENPSYIYIIVGLGLLSELYFMEDMGVRLITVAFVILFGLFALKSRVIGFLDNPLFRRIGVVSYTLYLIHEFLGVLLINKLGILLPSIAGIIPIALIIVFILFSEASFKYIEAPLAKKLKTLYKPSPSRKAVG